MKHKLKMGGIFALALFLVYLYGCQKEELESPKFFGPDINSNNGINYKYVKGNSIPNVIDVLNAQMRKSGKLVAKHKDETYYQTMNTSFGVVLFDNIMQVVDSLGNSNYTFKVIHPEDNYKTFFNLVMLEKEQGVKVQLIKYEMSEEFANLYRQGAKDLSQFVGSITTNTLTSPCLCEDPNDGLPIEVNPGDNSDGGSGGGGSGNPIGGPTLGSPGDGDSGGGNQSCVISIITTVCCQNIHWGYSSNCRCPESGGNNGATFMYNSCTGQLLQLNKNSRFKKGNTQNQTENINENDCCNNGLIGIMDDNDSENDPCKDLKKIKDSPSYNHIINFLKDKANGNKEYGWNYRKFPDSGGLQPPSVAGQLTSDNNRVDLDSYTGHEWIGAFHNHTNPTITNSIQMFSPLDVHWLLRRARYVNAYNIANSITTNFGDFFLGLVIQNHTYVIKIKDWDQFSSSLNQLDDVKDFYESLNKLYINLGSGANQESLQKAFLKTVKKYNMGIGLFEQDNVGIWNEIKLNPTNPNDLPIKVPCN